MRLIVRSNDPVLLCFVEALLREASIPYLLADSNMSILEGSIGILPRRILVHDEAWEDAARLLADAGISEWIVRE